MTTIPPSSSFFSPSSNGDAIAVLVLVETSAAMVNCWDDVKKIYLPTLLDTLRLNNPSVSMRICWQMTTETNTNQSPSGALPINSANPNEIPDITMDPNSRNALSTGSLRYSIETLKAAFRERQATRHLFVVAAATPTNDMISSQLSRGSHESWQAIALTLSQEKIRLHLILGTSQNTQPLRDLHEQSVQLQNSLVVPVWFSVDTSKFIVLLSGKANGFPSQATDPGPSARSMFQGPQSNPVSPTATSSSIPSSPTYDGPRTGHRSSPQSRRGKHRASAPSSPGLATGPPTHGIVSYLQQMHGLTKKRSYGQKSSKRITSGEQTRPSNSSRPILPRLDLPDSRLRGWSPYPVSSPPNRSIMEKTAAGGSRYSHIAPAPFDLSEDTHRARSRWPWLHPTPLPPTSSEQSAVYTNNSALRSLVSMAPRHPDFATRVADEAGIGFPSSSRVDPLAVGASYSHTDSPSHTSSQLTEWVADQHSQIVGVGLSSTPSPTIMTSPRTRGFWKSPTLSAQYHEQQSHSRATVSYDHPLDDNVRTPLASPSSPSENPEDPENQPFVITPEYEAMANARFEAAVRSGAMQASMTAATLSPIAASPLSIGSPSDYFGGTSVSNSSRLIMSLPQHPAASLPPQQPYSHRTMYSDPYIDLPSKTSDPSQYRDGSPVRQPYHWYGPI